ncbi:hypothetical protein [Kineosporia sp. NBRC 101677]|uniref:general stress protein n=1 Tax=Kineosporia sp. NBRC 101677 TaxID=3032197 RepID=UPI002554DE7C|nr:hypothetical protein [Kineosporia sp. NBRC 101677]
MIDDSFAEHPKTLSIPRPLRLSALGLWTMCGNWSSRHLTDGHITLALIHEKGGRSKHITALTDAGLWHDNNSTCTHDPHHCPGIPAPDTITYHDWYDWQRSRAQILRQRERKATAGRAGGKASGASRRAGPESSNEADASAAAEPPVPNPHPTPSLVALVSRRLYGDAPRETTLEELLPLWRNAIGDGDLDVELRNFLIHNADTDLLNPAAALLGWLARAAERAAKPGPRPVLGCAACTSGWLPDDPGTGMPRPCPTCKPHRYIC